MSGKSTQKAKKKNNKKDSIISSVEKEQQQQQQQPLTKAGKILKQISSRLDVACADPRINNSPPDIFPASSLFSSCPKLHSSFSSNSFVLIEGLPHSPFETLQSSASDFFSLPSEFKTRHNLKPHGPPSSPKSAGYMLGTLGGTTEFLDIRFRHLTPTYLLPGLLSSSSLLDLVTTSLLSPLSLPPLFSLPSHSLNLTQTVLRLASYTSSTFGSHTDTTFLTIVPPSKKGLQVYTPTGWLIIPENVTCIMAGELLEYTKGIPSCLHKVISDGKRLSTVYLVRQKDGGCFEGEDMNRIWAQLNPGMGAITDEDVEVQEDFVDVVCPVREEVYYECLGGKVLSKFPDVVEFSDVLEKSECSNIISLIDKKLDGGKGRSTIVSDDQKKVDGIRTSETCWMKHDETEGLKRLAERMAIVAGLPITHAEKWQGARYEAGGEYGLHSDHVEDFNGLECGGRCYSYIVYLNGDFEGGETAFPEIDIKVKPKQGKGLFFRNVREQVHANNVFEMDVDYDVLHKGNVVNKGTKYILTLWFHPVPL
ncbi:hypothetical protein TrVE_jg3716 [Triparma verrucosa]|uniref:Fe2OG dioxygenase domain-containing protein n=1 Tax=Triparma verrucosa TaxID=1606542 RepID=A0A9W7EZP6_9STRA|nr:hypothetical protein TrVE_jg3716 [Triparma verrucosa]